MENCQIFACDWKYKCNFRWIVTQPEKIVFLTCMGNIIEKLDKETGSAIDFGRH